MNRQSWLMGLLVGTLLAASASAANITCTVKNASSSASDKEGLLYHIVNSVPNPSNDRCTIIKIDASVKEIKNLKCIALYEGVQLIGPDAGVSLSFESACPNGMIHVYPDSKATNVKTTIANVNLNGTGIGINVDAHDEVLTDNYLTIKNVKVTSTDKGVMLNGGRVRIEGSTIKSTTGNGVEIHSDRNQLTGNTLSSSTKSGVAMIGAGARFNRIGPKLGADNISVNVISSNGSAGVLVDTGYNNLITRNATYSNGGLGIDLINNGNGGLPRPKDQVAIYKSGTQTPYLLIGKVVKSAEFLEVFESDSGTLDDNGEGKKYVISIPSQGIEEDWNDDGLSIFSQVMNGNVNTAVVSDVSMYSTQESESYLNTSEFSSTLVPRLRSFEGDPTHCRNAATANDKLWFLKSIDQIDVASGDVWAVDFDGDGFDNDEEDLDRDCVVDEGESDPSDPNDRPKKNDDGSTHTLCQKPYLNLLEAIICSLAEGIDQCIETNKTKPDTNNNDVPDICEDIDGDGRYGVDDNCPEVFNPDQADFDNDGVGDLCDDTDGDGIPNDEDNCPLTYNPDQHDLDGDGAGDVCDPDKENDGLMNPYCKVDIPATKEKECSKIDEETEAGTGSADPDSDDDRICDGPGWGYGTLMSTSCLEPTDNCPLKSNGSQTDFDEDTIGNACDTQAQNPDAGTDSDGDGFTDGVDNCPFIKNRAYNNATQTYTQADTDQDGAGDPCDPDDDNDGLDDVTESGMQRGHFGAGVPLDPKNPDSDGDGYCDGPANGGDGTDPLNPVDGKCTPSDNCYAIWNEDQADSDGDGIGDLCDFEVADSDGDTILDSDDNCLMIPNKDQRDTDIDGEGDACDVDDDSDEVTDVYEGGRHFTIGVLLKPWDPDSDHYKLTGTHYDEYCDTDALSVAGGEGYGPLNKFTSCTARDNCPTLYNPEQIDSNNNGVGDLCDAAIVKTACDLDGIADDADNCPCVYNPGQDDTDKDGVGDACDDPLLPPQITPGTGVPPGLTPIDIQIQGGGGASGGCSLVTGATSASGSLASMVLAMMAALGAARKRKC